MVVVVVVVVVQVGVDADAHAAEWVALVEDWRQLRHQYAASMNAWSSGASRWKGDNYMDLEFTWAWSEVVECKRRGVQWMPFGVVQAEVETDGATSSEVVEEDVEFPYIGGPGATIHEVDEEDEDDAFSLQLQLE